MSKQPEALRLADELCSGAIVMEHLPGNPGFNGAVLLIDDTEANRVAKACASAAAELKRLHALNAELVEALRDMHAGWKYIRDTHGDLYGVGWDRAQGKAESALATAW